jgi:hypothetical protein
MFKWLLRKLGMAPAPEVEYDEAAENAWHEEKSRFFQSLLGEEHDMVMHAIIPYAVGGGLDLYYYPNGISGTAVATKELVDPGGNGPSNSVYSCYELVMFTKHAIDLDQAKNPDSPFGAAHADINAILNLIARYSEEATLNPNETCEFPEDMEDVGGKCLIFDAYGPLDTIGPKGLGLMVVIQVHRAEMEFAMENGGEELISRLKAEGYYPYSDVDRPLVV